LTIFGVSVGHGDVKTMLVLRDCMKGDFIIAFMYDAAFAWAHAANKTLEQGIYPTKTDMKKFGKSVAGHLRKLDFDGRLFLAYLLGHTKTVLRAICLQL